MSDFERGNVNKDANAGKINGAANVGTPVTRNPVGTQQVATNANQAHDEHASSTAKPSTSPPGLDRTLGDANGRSDAEAQRQIAERNGEQVPPVPRNYEQYADHLKDKYGDDLEAMRKHKEEFDKNGGEEKRKTQKLALTPDEIAAKKAELEKNQEGMSEEDVASEKAKIRAMEQALPSAGKSMPQLLGDAQSLRDQIKAITEKDGDDPKNPALKAARDKLEGVMQASILLGTQIDPKGSKMGRELYNKLDKVENPALSEQARGEGQTEEEVAHGAVDQRNHLRQFVRSEMMDPTAAEILNLRDEGKTGSREGMSYDQVQKKEVGNLKKDGKLPAEFDIATATEAQKQQVYAAVIGSARTTNAGVNANMTGSSDGGVKEPEKQKPPGQ
jgi:hypothetical protein